MNPITQAVAGQLHPDEGGDRRKQDPVARLNWLREPGHRLDVVGPHFFSDEHEMDGAAWRDAPFVDEQIDARRMTQAEALPLDGIADPAEVLSRDRDVDVAGGTRRQRIPGCDVQEDRRPPTTR